MSLLCKSDNPIHGMKFGKLLLYVTLINEKITLDIRLFNIFFLTLEKEGRLRCANWIITGLL